MIVSIHQPAYMPNLGYFSRIARSDVHVVLDHVQFERGSFVNRNRILLDGKECWLTVPLRHPVMIPICQLLTADTHWAERHWSLIERAYGKSDPGLYSLLVVREWRNFNHIVSAIRDYFLSWLQVFRPRVLSSVDMRIRSVKSQLVLDICQRLGATTYLSGPRGRDYLDLPAFDRAGIAVEFDDRPQEPLSILHQWFTEGPDACRQALFSSSPPIPMMR